MARTSSEPAAVFIDGHTFPLGAEIVGGKIVYPEGHSDYYDATLMRRSSVVEYRPFKPSAEGSNPSAADCTSLSELLDSWIAVGPEHDEKRWPELFEAMRE